MSGQGATPLFVDTSAFYARADSDDVNHERATRVFTGIRRGDLPYRPLFTSQPVVAELATLLLRKLGHEKASETVTAISRGESFNVLPLGPVAFGTALDQFVDWDDQTISYVDHTSAVLAEERDVEHVFSFDGDFRTLGFSVLPGDLL